MKTPKLTEAQRRALAFIYGAGDPVHVTMRTANALEKKGLISLIYHKAWIEYVTTPAGRALVEGGGE